MFYYTQGITSTQGNTGQRYYFINATKNCKYKRRAFKSWGSKDPATQYTKFTGHKKYSFEYLKFLNFCAKWQ